MSLGLVCQVLSLSEGTALDGVMDRDGLKGWMEALFLSLYDGTEVEDVCNSCAVARSDEVYLFFSDEASSLWGSTFPLGEGTNDRFVPSLECLQCVHGDLVVVFIPPRGPFVTHVPVSE